MLPQWMIEKKRDGGDLSAAEITAFIDGYTNGTIPDYQAAAMAMAIYFQGMDADETSALTEAMMNSGERLDFSDWPQPTADKHSTGGIGDKVSLVLAPLVACTGVTVPMLSGRGLGITGGTLDKLESIPGYRTDLDTDTFRQVLRECGCSITGQTTSLAPADRKLYALRDVTGTVPSIPLIAASIMSKKLAEGAATLVLDVKFGRGAFMRDLDQAAELARIMVAIGTRLGRRVTALLTDMNQPLGRAVGNTVEICETIETLQGQGPSDLVSITLACGAEMLVGAGLAHDTTEAHNTLKAALDSGEAYERFCRMVAAHGGDTACLRDANALMPRGDYLDLPAPCDGVVTTCDAERIGRAVLLLGGGRLRIEDHVDHAVGITALRKRGEPVKAGQPLMRVWGQPGNQRDAALELLKDAMRIEPNPPTAEPLIRLRITTHGEEPLT